MHYIVHLYFILFNVLLFVVIICWPRLPESAWPRLPEPAVSADHCRW